MKYLSICSGIEAASVAFEPLGWTPLAFSEIEPFPRAVLQHHYPDTPCHGDFTVLKDEPWIVDADLLCGGTPCQAFSVAGNRQSLADDRGNLTLQFVLLADAIDALRHDAGREPAWILWENVPGVLSTNDNAFGAFLGGLVGRTAAIPEPEGGWTRAGVVDGPTRCAAWRVLDAQHFGLAQRRQRVFVLARGGAGRCAVADALLPIIEGSRWHPAPSRETGKAAPTIPSRSTAGGGLRTDFDCDGGVVQVCPTLRAGGNRTGGDRPPGTDVDTADSLIPVTFDPTQITSATNRSNPRPGDPCHTLHQSEPPMLIRMREGKDGGGKGPLVSEDQSLTLATGNDQVLALRTDVTPKWGDVGFTLTQPSPSGGGQPAAVMAGMQVRRLTPVETSRLQGFPDTYCHIPTNKWRKIPADEAAYLQRHGLYAELRGEQWYTNVAADGPIYKANGNSWAVPCARYIGERIKAVMTP